jgi:c-di-GMP-binding flagellar brake protein YcgR
VKKIVGEMVVLERQDRKSQLLTELVNLRLFYKKRGKEEETKFHPGTVSSERRKYPRVNVDFPTQYNEINSSISRNGRVMNLSEGGMLIHSPGQIEIGRHLNSSFSFPSGSEMNIIETLVEVAWMDIHSGEVRGDYRCGVKFIDVSPEDMTKLKKFLGSLLG